MIDSTNLYRILYSILNEQDKNIIGNKYIVYWTLINNMLINKDCCDGELNSNCPRKIHGPTDGDCDLACYDKIINELSDRYKRCLKR
jgi:hypothetical protein